MILLLDIGNSRIKWGVLESGSVSARGAVAHSAAEPQRAVREVFDDAPRPEAVWVANVGGAAIGAAAAEACRSRWGLSARFAAPAPEAFGVRNGYREADRLGVDRWLAMLAARARQGGPVCVVNCGTAVTIDIVDAGGSHLGGFVVPGMELMARSLSTATSGIRVTIAAPPADGPGRSTEECVVNGSGGAIAALLDRTMDRLALDPAGPTRCVMSGGGAFAVIPLMRSAVVHDPDLVLRGLALLAGSG